ncbi:ribonuclease domain-containing protein [Nocardia sp. NPDC004068]|uniref:ribonuclease domain-containing protein n=1 Tax=Nocardia sp. NPDC004068 TaxID=3364303 RepID=UPI0036792041
MNLSGKRFRSLLALGGVVVVVLLGLLTAHETTTHSTSSPTTSAKAVATPGKAAAAPTSRAPGVPDRAYQTLVEIDAGRWPDSADAPGTKGGDQWLNRDGTLPKSDAAGRSIGYREWDVNPKVRGQTRDAERIVTGSDGSAYYTGDHYRTFTKMR